MLNYGKRSSISCISPVLTVIMQVIVEGNLTPYRIETHEAIATQISTL